MWSDATGKQKRTREHAKLLSMHWHWVSDWLVDFHAPGGVDRDGWQYAVDFPASYHATKHFTDYVRRRRWYRRCTIQTTGPWTELGHTKVLDVSLRAREADTELADVWAVAAKGEALFRRGVSRSTPAGVAWEHVPCDQPLAGLSCGRAAGVWVVTRAGGALWRAGVTVDRPLGERWQNVEPPPGAQLRLVAAGDAAVWALDSTGRLCVRREITAAFPEGSHWQLLPNDPPSTGMYYKIRRYSK